MISTSQNEMITLDHLQGLFERCAERADRYDRENAFFYEDFRELKIAGYFLLPVPREMGGYGMSMDEVMPFQRKLAYYSAPTALAVHMHLHWVGLVADLWRNGDTSLGWILREAAAGKVFAAGHVESGHGFPVLYSTTKAEKVEGGYCFTGRKSFVSLSPVWSYLGFHGQDNSNPDHPRVIHAFLPRDSDGYEIRKTWDQVLGMRATRSDDTALNRVFIPDHYIARELDAGFGGMDDFVLGIFAWSLIGYGNIFLGQARSVFDLILKKLKTRGSISESGEFMAYRPGIQQDIAEMVMKLEAVAPQLDTLAREWSDGVDHGAAWPVKLLAAKCNAAEQCWEIVDRALDIAGGSSIFPQSDLERLFRDGRLGRMYPSDRYLTREVLGKVMLGIDLDKRPHWD